MRAGYTTQPLSGRAEQDMEDRPVERSEGPAG
jgi:hypothetical protein